MNEGVHFTVASAAGHNSPRVLDLSQDLALVKASLLDADKVRLCSAGSSVLSSIAGYAEAPAEERAKLVVRYLLDLQPSMDPDEVRFFEVTVGLRPRKERRAVPRSARREILSLVRKQDDELRRGLDRNLWRNLSREPYPLETNLPGVFAAGDVRTGSIKRVASAVGEGSMAVRLVHQYLNDGGVHRA